MKTIDRWKVIVIACVLSLQGIFPGAILHAETIASMSEVEPFSLPLGKVGTEYEFQFQTEGGLAPLTWKVIEGALPTGVKLDATGKLHGVPTAPQREAYRFVVEVSDSSQPPQRYAQPVLLMVQASPLRILTSSAPLKISLPKEAQPSSAASPKLEPESKSSEKNLRPDSSIVPSPPKTAQGSASSSSSPIDNRMEAISSKTNLAPSGTPNKAASVSAPPTAPTDNKIEIVSPTNGEAIDQQQVLVKVKVDSTIRRILVVVKTVDDKIVGDLKDPILLSREPTWSHQYTLAEGTYTITVSDADDSTTTAATASVKVVRRMTAPVASRIQTRFVIVDPSSKGATVNLSCDPSSSTSPKLKSLTKDYPLVKSSYPIQVQVIDANCQGIANQEVVIEKRSGYGEFQGDDSAAVTKSTDGDGFVRVNFSVDELPGPTVISAYLKSLKTGTNEETTLELNPIDLNRWRYALEIGNEFNRDLSSGFGRPFLYVGLTTNTHWGRSLHTQFDARLTSVLTRDLLAGVQTTPSTTTTTATTPPAATDINLTPFFDSQRAFEAGFSLFKDGRKIYQESALASDRPRFGWILKYQFRSRVNRKTENEIAEIQQLIANQTDATKRAALQMKLDQLLQVAEPPKDVISEFFGGLRIAHYGKHYISEVICLKPSEATGNDMLDDLSDKKIKCEKSGEHPYRHAVERNTPAKAYFHLMYGWSEHLQFRDRLMVQQLDAQGKVVVDPVTKLPVTVIRNSGFPGRVMLEGYMKVPRVPVGLRFNANLGHGEDEIRFSLFTALDLNQLKRAIRF